MDRRPWWATVHGVAESNVTEWLACTHGGNSARLTTQIPLCINLSSEIWMLLSSGIREGTSHMRLLWPAWEIGQKVLLYRPLPKFLQLFILSMPSWVLVLKGLVGLHRIVQLHLLQCYWLGHTFGLPWYWMVCLGTNRDHSVVFEIASKYCILDSFVDYEGYSISSKGFFPQ